MMKLRMNIVDIAAEVKCLRSLIGMSCNDVYDLSPQTSEASERSRVMLLLESGVRFHTTTRHMMRDTVKTPSGFTLQLGQYIQKRRLEDLRQVGLDKKVLFQFGAGADACFIILELYAQGNIIVTGPEFLVLLEHRRYDGLANLAPYEYTLNMCDVFEPTDGAKLLETLNGKSKSVKPNATSKTTLKVFLGEAFGYGPAIWEHIILDAGLNPRMEVYRDLKLEDSSIEALSNAVKNFEAWLEDVRVGTKVPEGYILVPSESSVINHQIYDAYCPFLYRQLSSRVHIKFDSFDAALDAFYGKRKTHESKLQRVMCSTDRYNTQKVEEYKKILQKLIDLRDYSAIKTLIDHLMSDHVAVLVSLKLMDYMAEKLENELKDRLELGNYAVALVKDRVKAARRLGMPIAGCLKMSNLDYDTCLSPPHVLPETSEKDIRSWKENESRYCSYGELPYDDDNRPAGLTIRKQKQKKGKEAANSTRLNGNRSDKRGQKRDELQVVDDVT